MKSISSGSTAGQRLPASRFIAAKMRRLRRAAFALLLPVVAVVASTVAMIAVARPQSHVATAPITVAPLRGVPATAPRTVSHGRFVDVPIRMPAGDVRRFVFWFVDGLSVAAREQRLQALTADGAMVAVVAVAPLEQALRKDGGSCVFSAGDVENFSRYVQAYVHLSTYHAAIVLGDGEGAALAYAVAAQAPKDTFAGAVSLGFCPTLATGKAVCAGSALALGQPRAGRGRRLQGVTLRPGALMVPWFHGDGSVPARCPLATVDAFAGGVDTARALPGNATADGRPDSNGQTSQALLAALRRIGSRRQVTVAPPPPDLAGLPVVEVPAAPGVGGDTFAVFASGDGGWAGLDKQVAGALAQAGIPVVGLDSLRYFWTARTPQGLAVDLDRIVRYYARRWGRNRVILIGFSQGADVLPAAIADLPPATARMVALNALLSIGRSAAFEFHVSNWLGGDGDGRPIAPDLARLPHSRTLCIYGEDDADAICPDLKPGMARVIKLPGDHHFDGDYARLAALILHAIKPTPAAMP